MNIFWLGLPELIVIAFILLLLFWKDRLPELFRSMWSSIKEFKNGIEDITPKEKTKDSKDTNESSTS